jgi:hypothetical protein
MRLCHLFIASTFMVGITVHGAAMADTTFENTNLPGNDYSNMGPRRRRVSQRLS